MVYKFSGPAICLLLRWSGHLTMSPNVATYIANGINGWRYWFEKTNRYSVAPYRIAKRPEPDGIRTYRKLNKGK